MYRKIVENEYRDYKFSKFPILENLEFRFAKLRDYG